MHRYYYDRSLITQLYNAGKYFTGILASLIFIVYKVADRELNEGIVAYRFYLAVLLISTVYSYVWDIYMDWGLLRCKDSGKYGLRKVINYSPNFYYYAIVSDLVLRFSWIFRALIDENSYPWF